MKKRRYSDEYIVRILREADKDPVPEVAKLRGVKRHELRDARGSTQISLDGI